MTRCHQLINSKWQAAAEATNQIRALKQVKKHPNISKKTDHYYQAFMLKEPHWTDWFEFWSTHSVGYSLTYTNDIHTESDFALDPNGTLIDESEYPKVFFLMHKWIMESEHLSNMLYDLFKHNGDDYKKTIIAQEKRQFKECQLRVCQAYR